jgi:cbb3-type cytochrome c oxidase subunit III
MEIADWKPLLLAAALLAAPCLAAAQRAADSLPPGVSRELIADGEKIFKGTGLCHACHGPDGKGIEAVKAPNLTDTVWLHSKGTYDDIVRQVTTGVPSGQSKGGGVMAPRGGMPLTDAQVRAVAAYVWSLRLNAPEP